MVIATQMKHTVSDQKCELSLLAVSIAFRLLFDPVHRNNDIPEDQFSCIRIKIICLSVLRDLKIPRLIEIQIGEGQYISLPVNLPVFLIVSMNTVIVCQQYI